jgi:Ni,Fe-hydrogenase III large subunit
MHRIRTLAIDPGQTCGFALHDNIMEETKTWCDDYNHMLTAIDSMAPDTVVIERFVTAGRLSKYGLLTIELVGMARGFCRAKGINIITRMAYSRHPYQVMAEEMRDAESKGMHRTGKRCGHENDALAHLLWYRDKVKDELS